MFEDEQDEPIRNIAANFRDPPATPREEIWARIQAARSAETQPSGVLPFRPVARRQRPAVRALAWVAGVAALLAAGIGIGRLIPTDDGPLSPALATGAGTDTTSNDGEPGAALAMVVRQYLSRTETVLAGVRSGDQGAEFAGVARDLLGMTRLLLDSPSLTDAATQQLLHDLELILTQIVLLPASGDAEAERRLITAGIAGSNLMPRLQHTIPTPAGSAPAVYGEL
jgi:hypothetical protein